MGFYAPSTIVEDAKRHGVEIRPVDLLHSDWDCSIEAGGVPVRAAEPTDTGHTIRMGLRYVKGLSRTEALRIISARNAADFDGLEQDPRDRDQRMSLIRRFLKQARVRKDRLAHLAQSGAFTGMGISRRDALWLVLGPSAGIGDAVQAEQEMDLDSAFTPQLDALGRFDEIRWDYIHSMHSASGHPVEAHRSVLMEQDIPSASRILSCAHGTRVRYAGLIICRQHPATANGTVFLTLEDETGFVNLIIWKKVFQANRRIILQNAFLGVEGEVQRADGVCNVIVSACFVPRLSGSEHAVSAVGPVSHDFR